MLTSRSITLYRIVWENPPTVEDVTSNKALGKQPRGDDPKLLRMWDGISLWDSAERARDKARRNPWKGNAYIAELQIPLGAFRMEQTFSNGHYTLWGDPDAILGYVTRVERV